MRSSEDAGKAEMGAKEFREKIEALMKEKSDWIDHDMDQIRLGESGWRERYYHEKVDVIFH